MSTDDESFHPLGEEWEDELESMLDDTEYDSELGMKMAQDAMRVTEGDLSEAEFHDRYHEEVMEEFGEDERPTKEAYEAAQEEAKGTASSMLERFDGDGEETRRETMKKMGVGAAAVGMGAFGTAADGPEESLAAEKGPRQETTEESDIQWGMTIDLDRCDGCLSCMTACTEENDLDQGVNWMYVMAWEDENHPGASESGNTNVGSDFNRLSDYNMLVRPCQHCTDAPCEKVCPTTARHTRDKDGLVLTDYDVCIGCRYCQVACPYGVNYFQWDDPSTEYEDIDGFTDPDDPDEITHADYEHGERWVDSRAPRGVMSKCTMCPSMQDGRQGEEHVGTTACERACPPNAIQFGNVKDEASDPSQHREYPTKSRAVINVNTEVPSPDVVNSNVSDGDSLEDAIEAIDSTEDADLDADTVAIAKAIEIRSREGETDPGDEENNSILEKQQTVLEFVSALAEYVALESEASLETMGLDTVDSLENAAQIRLEQYAGDPSSFQLLEDIGTNPNVTYLGTQPGPEAHQVEGPTKYEDVDLLDNRMEDLEEGTVGRIDGVSL